MGTASMASCYLSFHWWPPSLGPAHSLDVLTPSNRWLSFTSLESFCPNFAFLCSYWLFIDLQIPFQRAAFIPLLLNLRATESNSLYLSLSSWSVCREAVWGNGEEHRLRSETSLLSACLLPLRTWASHHSPWNFSFPICKMGTFQIWLCQGLKDRKHMKGLT